MNLCVSHKKADEGNIPLGIPIYQIHNGNQLPITKIPYVICHSNIVLEEPANIAYLYDLAEQNPLTYTKLAFKENGLQDYMDAIEEFN